MTISPTGELFSIVSQDKVIRIYDFLSGKLKRKYDESIKVYHGKDTIAVGGLDSLEMGRREAIERELESSAGALSMSNAIFDETGNFLIYASLIGVKIVNLVDNRVVRTVGMGESGGERFLHLALYQGIPKVDKQYLLSKGGESSSNTVEELQVRPIADPTIYATSFKRRRFYCFSRREPDESKDPRDVFNEMPSEEEKLSSADDTRNLAIGREAVLHTNLGDIEIHLFGNECPKTVENFCVSVIELSLFLSMTSLTLSCQTHAKNGYYNGVIFHRVIKGFMIQTGDPRGDGTGGESIWGGEFEDEFVKSLK
jgi:peptidylprolyl isomerase domain and WD repeat-containing protein 1